LQDGIVVAEEHHGNFAGFADFADQMDDLGERCAGFQSPLGGALNRGAVSEGIAEGNAKFYDIGAGIGEGQNEFMRGI